MQDTPPSPAGAGLAYALSAVTTLLWVGCVLPSGMLAAGLNGDAATPMHRSGWLLVGAMVLLVVGPVGATLARTRVGQRAVLSTTDAFVCLYAAGGLTGAPVAAGQLAVLLISLLYGLAFLSVLETVRLLRPGGEALLPTGIQGIRLAIALLVLVLPSWLIVTSGRELGSLLAPFAFVAISAAGANAARTVAGLRFTAALLHSALAVHVLVTLRYTIYEAEPRLLDVNGFGWVTLGLSGLAALLAVTLVGWRFRYVRRATRQVAAQASPAP
ncbi:MAG: hypothetical protein ACYTG6_01605 [Planctomycetota bacterium]|jgi:hypothetical protein